MISPAPARRLLATLAASMLALPVLVGAASPAAAAADYCRSVRSGNTVIGLCHQLGGGSQVRGVATCRLQAIHGGYGFSVRGPWVSEAFAYSRATCPSGTYYVGKGYETR